MITLNVGTTQDLGETLELYHATWERWTELSSKEILNNDQVI